MQRIRIERPGGYERLLWVEAPDPVPADDEVHVGVRASGVSYADSVVRMGLYESAKKYVGWPITPGFEFAGTVKAAGRNATRFRPGDRVFGVSRFGAYATDVVVREQQLFPMPSSFSFEQAGSFPVAFLTAWYALAELCKLRPGNRVLIHSAAGGVGGAAIQVAKAQRAIVIGVVGANHKVERAKEFGADHVIDKSTAPLWPTLEALYPDGVDVVLDPNGVETLKQSYRHLRPTGRLVIYGFQTMLSKGRPRPNWFKLVLAYLRTPRFDPMELTNDNKSVLAFNLSYLFEHLDRFEEAMRELLSWVESGSIRPLPLQVFPLERAADAQRALESGTTTGKLVLTTTA